MKAKTRTVGWESTPAHYHTADSKCLEAVDRVPAGLWITPPDPETGADKTVYRTVAAGWFRCTEREHYWVHDHGFRFVSHFPDDAKWALCP